MPSEPREQAPTSQARAGSGESYAGKTVKSVAWLGGSQLLRQGAAIVTTVVLARLLTPADYGIFAMTLFINELAQLLVNFGIGSALIQRKQINQLMLSTCFWLNLAIAGVVAGLVVLAAPAAADFYRQPKVAELLLVSALTVCIGALMVIPQVVLSRELRFHHVAVGASAGSLIGAAATIALAVSGAGVWALVAQPLIGTTINLAFLAWRAGWWPSWRFQLSSVRGVIVFSSHLLIDGLASHFTRNLQQLIVAPVLGATAIGLLTMATMAAWLPVSLFTQAAAGVLYPVFSKLQDEKGRLLSGIRRATVVIAIVTFPLLSGLAILAPDVMPLMFGQQWSATAPLVSVLCVLCMVQSVSGVGGSAMLAQGRSLATMNLSLLGLPLVGTALWLTRDIDILSVTIALAVSHGIISILKLHLALRSMPGGWAAMIGAVWQPLLCALGMAAVLWVARGHAMDWSPAVRLVLLICAGALTYVVLTLALNRQGWSQLLEILQQRGG